MKTAVSMQLTSNNSRTARKRSLTVTLWTIQGLLALLFLFAGSMKLAMPIEMLTAQIPLPGLFLRFIGVAEVAGALGLILPGLLRIQPALTALAACGLVLVMVGATVFSLLTGGIAAAAMPLVMGLLCVFIAYNRRENRRVA